MKLVWAKETQTLAVLWSRGPIFIVARVCFPCGPRRPVVYLSDHFVGAENCLLTRINPDCRTPAVVSLFD